jgi:AhpD family alkylhydroperoxidase
LIKYIHPVKPSLAEGLVAEVYAQAKRDFGMGAEPFQIHSPVPKVLAGAWMVRREVELLGNVPRPVKEAVAAAVSQLNQCPYCVDAHTIMLSALGENATANAINKVRIASISDPKTRMATEWALATTSPWSDLLRWLPFSRQESPKS